MGVFGDWAEKYADLGINVIPIMEEKKPPKKFQFQRWLHEKQTPEEMEQLLKDHSHAPGIAVVCGSVSGICALDFDYKYDAVKMKTFSEAKWKQDNSFIDAEIRKYLPTWTLAKMAREGWTVFFKMQDHYRTIAPDRHGVRLFDFKASGYIVIPPSFHSFNGGASCFYKWIEGDPMTEFQNLPDIDFGLIEDFALLFGQKKRGKGAAYENRHWRIYVHGSGLAKIESDPVKIATSMMEYDVRIHKSDPKGLYFSDRKHCGIDGFAYARRWAERLVEYSKNSETKSASGQDVYDYFFLNKMPYGQPKKDILTRKVFYRHPADDRWAAGDELIYAIKSYGTSSGLEVSKIETEYQRFQEEYNAKDFLVEIPKHDGVDYLKAHVSALKSSAFTTDELYEIFLNWGYLLFARIFDSEIQNRCLIIKGNQGIGKDDWIKAMVKDFKPYYQPLSINRDEGEMISAVQRLFVAHLSEFDQTKKLDMAFIKDLITNSTSFMREKYGRVALERPMRASWISSVNIEHMLRDTTGNRRFVVLPIEAIDWSYKKIGLRILSQFKDAYERGIGQSVSSSVEAKIKKIIDGLTPDDIDDDIEGIFINRLEALIDSSQNDNDDKKIGRIESIKLAEAVSDIARIFQVSVKRVYAVAKKHKFSSDGTRYYRVTKKTEQSVMNP